MLPVFFVAISTICSSSMVIVIRLFAQHVKPFSKNWLIVDFPKWVRLGVATSGHPDRPYRCAFFPEACSISLAATKFYGQTDVGHDRRIPTGDCAPQ
jgi:hypothetical protein